MPSRRYPGGVDDAGAVAGRVVDGPDEGRAGERTGVGGLQRHDPHPRGQARDPGAVVGVGADGAGDVGAVVVGRGGVVGLVVVVGEVPAAVAPVVRVAVAVVVDAVGAHLPGVAPHHADQVGVAGLHARVDDGDGDPGA